MPERGSNIPGTPGYPSRRDRPAPNDAMQPYQQPPTPGLPDNLQMTAPPPPMPTVPGPGEANFRPAAIPGTSMHNVNSREADPTRE